MKKAIALIAFILIAYPVSASAFVGLGIGGKIGLATYSGDILPASGDVGSSAIYGAIVEIAALPVVDFEVHLNYFTKDFEYTYDVLGVSTTTPFEFQDLHALVLAKKNLIPIPMSPVGIYLGGGLGWHLINTEVAKSAGTTFDPSLADNPFTLMKNSVKTSGHGLVGVKVSPPMIPLAVFGEARFGRIFTENGLTTTQIEAGLMIGF